MASFSDLFGFSFKTNNEKQIPSVVAPAKNDGALVLDNSAVTGGWTGTAYDIDGVVKTENEQIRRYRDIAGQPEVDSAISDIVNECVVTDQDDHPVKLFLDNLKVSDALKKKFNDCFIEILNKLDFNLEGHDIIRQWYVDGRIYYHILFVNNDISKGIAELRLIDPLKIKKIKNIKRTKNNRGIDIVDSIEEYYIYNDKGVTENNIQGVKLTADSVVMIHSGSIDSISGSVIGFLQKVIKPANQLRMIEDAVVIYTMTRAPDRRVFYIDVGNLPKVKAEQYVTDIMNKFKNKLIYNAATGEIADSKRNLSMTEDFWLARRDSKSTEITTLQGSQSLIQSDFIDYFQNKLYQSLNVPIGRMKPETGFTLGRSSEVTRDELKFSKFVGRLRIRFSGLFSDLMKIQLVSKGLIRLDEWDDIRAKIRFDFIKDNHFTELKNAEIITNRMTTLQMVDPFLGKYVSKKWVQKNVLMLDDEEIVEMENQIKEDGPIPGTEEMPAIEPPAGGEEDPAQDQEMDQSQEAHDQKIRQSEELHQQKLKDKK
jgi:hypothetical protein